MVRLHSYDDNLSFFIIDQHAEQAPNNVHQSMDSLLEYLSEPIPDNDPDRNIYLIRALLKWFGQAQRKRIALQTLDLDSPYYLVLLVQSKAISYTEAFCTLCKEAGILHEHIKGWSKSAAYRVGKANGDDLRNSWITFEGNGKWHFFNPCWILSAVVGYSLGDVVTLEKDGKAILEQEQAGRGTHIFHFNHRWFCPHPEYFIHHCFPEDKSWQNLPTNKQILTLSDFLLMPYLQYSYFEANLQLISHRTCIISSVKGKCLIAFTAEQKFARHLHFSYKLSLFGHDASGLNADDLPLLVFYSRSRYTSHYVVEFKIRFPKVGHYLFEAFVGNSIAYMDECFEFKIICDEADPECKKLPLHTGVVGWGYGPTAMDAGIKSTSLKSGEVLLKRDPSSENNLETEIKVTVDEEALDQYDFSAYICGDDSTDTGTMTERVPTDCNKETCTLKIKPSVQRDGDYALQLRTNSQNIERPVYNVLLKTKTDDYLDSRKEVRKMEKEVRHNLKMEDKIEVKSNLEKMVKDLQDDIENYGSDSVADTQYTVTGERTGTPERKNIRGTQGGSDRSSAETKSTKGETDKTNVSKACTNNT